MILRSDESSHGKDGQLIMELIHALFHSSQRGPLTLQGIKELANIHYWAVSIIPVLLGSALAYTAGNKFDLLVFVLLLPAAISMHCVVNAYNHLFDYLRGTDRGEEKNSSRYPILYYGINPLYVLILGVVYLLLAFVLSFYVVLQAGWPLLMIGAVGAFIAVFYSGGPFPLAHYPLGEFASGTAMGGLIPFAVYYGMTGSLDWIVLVYTLPMILTIGILCFINNICDIEKDSINRRTLPILIGRPLSSTLFRVGYGLTWICALLISVLSFTKGCWILILSLVLAWKKLRELFRMDYTPSTRNIVIPLYASTIPILNVGYTITILLQGLLH